VPRECAADARFAQRRPPLTARAPLEQHATAKFRVAAPAPLPRPSLPSKLHQKDFQIRDAAPTFDETPSCARPGSGLPSPPLLSFDDYFARQTDRQKVLGLGQNRAGRQTASFMDGTAWRRTSQHNLLPRGIHQCRSRSRSRSSRRINNNRYSSSSSSSNNNNNSTCLSQSSTSSTSRRRAAWEGLAPHPRRKEWLQLRGRRNHRSLSSRGPFRAKRPL